MVIWVPARQASPNVMGPRAAGAVRGSIVAPGSSSSSSTLSAEQPEAPVRATIRTTAKSRAADLTRCVADARRKLIASAAARHMPKCGLSAYTSFCEELKTLAATATVERSCFGLVPRRLVLVHRSSSDDGA